MPIADRMIAKAPASPTARTSLGSSSKVRRSSTQRVETAVLKAASSRMLSASDKTSSAEMISKDAAIAQPSTDLLWLWPVEVILRGGMFPKDEEPDALEVYGEPPLPCGRRANIKTRVQFFALPLTNRCAINKHSLWLCIRLLSAVVTSANPREGKTHVQLCSCLPRRHQGILQLLA